MIGWADKVSVSTISIGSAGTHLLTDWVSDMVGDMCAQWRLDQLHSFLNLWVSVHVAV